MSTTASPETPPGGRRLAEIARRFIGLSSRQRRFLAAAWVGAPVVELSLRLAGLGATLRWVDRLPTTGRAVGAVDPNEGEFLVRAAWKAHLIPARRCLHRSVLQYLVHRWQGTPARFVVGVRHGAEGELEAHAWVESPGGDRGDRCFEPILEAEQP